MKKKLKQIFQPSSRRHSSLRTVAEREDREIRALSNDDIRIRMKRIHSDFESGFRIIQNHPNTVSFFGSARFDEHNEYYQQARHLAKRIAQELGITIVSGGGRGIMEAANRGAHDVNGDSVGMTIELPYEQVTNEFVTHSSDFYYFFSRKVALAFAARAYVYFPGGFGTMDEFFEILTLKQTGKIKPIPIILVGSSFWQPLLDYIETTLQKQNQTIGENDTQLYTLTDDFDEIIKIIEQTKPSSAGAAS
ncbi:MAG: TIGR00730 family Rossman fold protein [Candidatus Saccharimonadales bacterium]